MFINTTCLICAYETWACNGLSPIMMTSSNGSILRVTHRSPVHSTHKGQWREALNFFFDFRLNKRLSKQWRRRLFETPSRSLWRHCNDSPLSHCPNRYWFMINGYFKQTSIKFYSQFKHVHSWKCMWKYCPQNGGNLVQTIRRINALGRKRLFGYGT